MANATLNAIRNKVRRITRSPSLSLLSNADLDEYINTFILYDFPEHLRLFSLRTTFTFYTQPGVDVYENEEVDQQNPLFNFKNKYISVHPPFYVAGFPASFTQWRNVFFGAFPQTNNIADTQLRGNNTPGPFVGIVDARPMLQNNVIFTALDNNGSSMVLRDYPVSNVLGAMGPPNTPQVLPSPFGQINYLTGAFSITFPNPTLLNTQIWVENIPYQPGRPNSILYYDNKFTLRPVPDKAYPVQMEADVRPTELLQATDEPYLAQWWTYIALGAARRVFEDKLDTESLNQIMPLFMEQQNLVNRASLVQQANQRSVTLFTNGKQYGWGWYGYNGWPN